MICSILSIIICIIIFGNNTNQQKTKIWIPNTNYNDRKNWLGHQVPCESSKVVFPDDLSAAVYLPGSLKLKEIQLPNDGELLLESDHSVLEFTGEGSYPGCQREVVQFKKINIEPWLKPSNWQTKDSSLESSAIPHLEHVPCMTDNVLFPAGSTFYVLYPDISLSVNSLQIENRNVTDAQLQQFLVSEPGTRQFRSSAYQQRVGVVSVKRFRCLSPSGCLCHPAEIFRFVANAVCRRVKVCPDVHCLQPVKPVGHCCAICGAHLLITFDPAKFQLKRFIEQIHEYLTDYSSLLNIHVSKVLHESNPRIQVIILEKDSRYKGQSVSAARELHQQLMSDLNLYKILHSDLAVSGAEYWPSAHFTTTLAIMFGSLLTVLMMFAIIYVVFHKETKLPWLPFRLPSFRPFLFVRFENNAEQDGVEIRNRSVASSLFNLDRAFDNPLYDEHNVSETTSEHVIEPDESNKAETLEFQNMLFSELQEKADSE